MWKWGENPSRFYLQQEHRRARPALPALCLALVLPLLLICSGQNAPIAWGHAGEATECLQGVCSPVCQSKEWGEKGSQEEGSASKTCHLREAAHQNRCRFTLGEVVLKYELDFPGPKILLFLLQSCRAAEQVNQGLQR